MTSSSFSDDVYAKQLANKTENLKQIFAQFLLPDLKVYPSPIKHYRMRAEFRIWHNGEDLYHIMYDKACKQRVRVDSFPIASTLINQGMQQIIPLLKNSLILRDLLFQIDYLSTLSGELLITLLYHKKLDDNWSFEAKKLKQQLVEQGLSVNIVGRATNQKVAIDKDYVDEKLPILDREFTYRQIENSFTQPNAAINIAMLNWAVEATKNATGDLLEFYCGNGNFSIALAQNFRQVLATEVAKTSVNAAQYNIAVNKITNLKIIRLSAAEFTMALNKERTFKRLNGIDLNDYSCNTVLVDPPRSGLDDETLNHLKNYETILYISCNPLTLRDNLNLLCQTHKIKEIALFDQFPYTDHIETGVVLSKIEE